MLLRSFFEKPKIKNQRSSLLVAISEFNDVSAHENARIELNQD
ncbi:hypothetical protein SR1949_53100 [Sphaerospermopsis reniformis]|uniref:Uncharacterized protein n=1 Tax=Sphaerospermopsis reniformis TaxID=531300 RepID=A0A480A8B3_9CYAN|nr:hypothetical protein SR1949_53100 [Sphaerospermopsis reniformis]